MLRAKAALAAQFEDCAQAVEQVHAALTADPSAEQHTSLRVLIERCLGRLTTWGRETGASSRVLDHSLRRASAPRHITIILLSELHNRLQSGTHVHWLGQCLDTQLTVYAALETLPAMFEGADGFGERPMKEWRGVALASGKGYPQETLDILGPEGDGLSSDPQSFLAEADAIIDDLSDLRSILLDPYDDDDLESPQDASQLELADREYVQRLFVQAAPFLVERLLAANRRRRQAMHHMKHTTKGTNPHLATFPGYTRAKRPQGELGSRSTRSFSDDPDMKEPVSYTSISSSDTSTGSLDGPELQPPAPPVRLNNGKNIPFQCEFCSYEVPLEPTTLNMGLDDWVAHFFLDIQPYVCTFEGCSRAYKLFGRKEEWFQHELDYHRTRQAWHCVIAGCETEYNTPALLEQHIHSNHPNVISQTPPEFLGIFIGTCQRLSLAPQPGLQQHCILCGSSYEEAQVEWKDHLAHHLEQFAMLAIGENEEPPPDVEERDRETAIEEYLEEVTAISASGRDPTAPHRPVESFQGSFADDYFTEASDSGREWRQSGGALWEEKARRFLKEGIGIERVEGNEAIEKIWLHVPNRNEDFAGRENDLHRLNVHMSQPGHICVISGGAGVGKTATAVEYARRYEANYSAVIWIEADTPGGLSDMYNSIGTKILSLNTETRQDSSSFTLTIRSRLERWERRWLLIFNNVGSWDDISRYIPRGLPKTKGSVLIVTRQQDLVGMEVQSLRRALLRVELDALTADEGAQFLIHSMYPQIAHEDTLGHTNYKEALKVANLVSRSPMALEMVAGNIRMSQMTLADFIKIWETNVELRAKDAR